MYTCLQRPSADPSEVVIPGKILSYPICMSQESSDKLKRNK